MRLFIILLSSLTLLGMGCESLGGGATMETRIDSMSYALGQVYAKDIKSGVIDQGVELDTDLLMEAFRSTQGEDPAEPILDDQQIQLLLFNLQQELRSKAGPPPPPQQPTSQPQANPNANGVIKTGPHAPDVTQPTPQG
ncbi:MAG: FKBP-type peptidyl-prolyl cis-trans isomerase N-terminal domain-containing protein, partial [Bacteroidota bacterium]